MAMDYFLASRQRRFTQLFHRLQQQHPQLRLARQQTATERLRQQCVSPWSHSLSAQNSGKSAPFCV